MQSWRIAVLFFLFFSEALAQQKFTISGYVKEAGSMESLPGVNVQIRSLYIGTSTNEYGFYSLTLNESDSIELEIFMTGYERQKLTFTFHENKDLNIDLQPVVKEIKEVVVTGKRQQESVSDNAQMSTIDIPVSQIKNIPTLMGEKDVLKTLQLMPGVQKGSEGSAGIYVRGGGPDQNLLILDDAVVYNAQHLFGFFSVFNGDALKSVELTKGGFPARYGGRLSSVINMNMKDGNKESYHGEAGIGLISSRLVLEGPIVKKKSSFIVSGRRTYADLLIYPLLPEDSKGGYFFYDFNAKANYEFNDKNKIYLSGYLGKDQFYFNDKGTNYKDKAKIYWGNTTSTFRWNHLFTKKLFMNTSAVFSTFNFNVSNEYSNNDETFYMRYFSRIRDYSIKSDLDYALNPQHTIKIGAITTLHYFTPQALESRNSYNDENIDQASAYEALESGVYIEDIYKPHPRWILNGGIRLSSYISDDISYVRPEPRFTMAFKIKDDLSIKGSYARMNQYLHLLSNTGIGLPTDLWVPSTSVALPENSWQVAGGFAKDLPGRNLAVTLEGYYKETNNIISYKEGASFLEISGENANSDNMNWENTVTQGRGWSYGAELLIQRKLGKFSGWAGYTLSWTWQQFDSLNYGKKFYARYDRRHDISLVGIYKANDKITFSAVWVFGTGNAVTLPTALVPVKGNSSLTQYQNYNNPYYVGAYEERNNYRMPAYHRLDIGIQFHKEKKKFTRTWDLSIYNVYSRLNAFYLDFRNENEYTGNVNSYSYALYKIALFPLIPSITYNIKF